eukprot:350743-Pleurochrysis_carterae.AAC.1
MTTIRMLRLAAVVMRMRPKKRGSSVLRQRRGEHRPRRARACVRVRACECNLFGGSSSDSKRIGRSPVAAHAVRVVVR